MQYKQKVMQCLSKIKNKKIALIVAHPDDETLWFFQSIQKLRVENEIVIFCLTHTEISKRGRELSKVVERFALKVVLGHCEDVGINHLLKNSEVRQAFVKIFSENKFDLAITHPPHGGEKPHPHHIQLFNVTKEFCENYGIQFGFFSERKLLNRGTTESNYYFSFNEKKYVLRHIMQGYRLLEDECRMHFLMKSIYLVLFSKKNYSAFEVNVNLEEKQAALSEFESQKDILKSYKAFYNKSEFLFLE